MAYDLSAIKTTRTVHPPRILIYGQPGLGKTSLAAEFPNPVIIDIEEGVPAGIEIPTLGEIGSYADVVDRVGALLTQDHDFKTLIIDSLDKLEPLIWSHVCSENNWSSIEEPGYGKGYMMAGDIWSHLLRGLNKLRRDRQMNIVFTCHSSIERFDDPQTGPYSRYDIRLHKRAKAAVEDEVDAILFVNQDVAVVSEDAGFNKQVKRGEGGDFRWIFTEGRPAYTAKNRFGLPPKIKYDKGQGYSQLASLLPCQQVAKPAAKTKEKEAA